MHCARFLASVATLTGAILAATPAFAQPAPAMRTVPVPTPDADALAGAMRRLAANPRDVDALLTAGELSLKLGDASGAASLFKRAEQVDPANGRVKAGMASILVRSERPGEALRYFGQAEGFGYDPRRFASDRALAYDLIGEQERAQRDYRRVLKSDPDDETVRRYALSLGISGHKDEALEQIDTLLRKNDRGAWRARAFILAMNGDAQGATKIATSMIPGMARALQPFFTRLPALAAADRAFAVHFGEVGPTPERLADARLTPALAPLPPEARAAPVLVAAMPILTKPDRKSRRERRQRERVAPVKVASVAPRPAKTPPPPGFGSAGASPTDPVRVASVVRRDATPIQRNEALRVAGQSRPRPASATTNANPAGPPVAGASPAPPTTVVPKPVEVATASPVSTISAAPASTSPAPVTTQAASASPSTQIAASVAPSSGVGPSVAGPPSTAASPPVAQTVASAPASAAPVPPRMSEDSILAKIVAGIAIPGYELGVGPPPAPPAATQIVSTTTVAPSAAGAAPVVDAAAAERQRADELAATKAAEERAAATRKEETRAALAEKKRADAKALAAKKAADAKALATKKAAEEKALAAKQAAAEKKAANADPPRIWVQVAGGAFPGDLPKAWAAVKGKASALSGRQGYATPLRATNRVVTGPFKTADEAQALVNTLGKQGVSAFTFTSTAGQKVTRLPAK